LLTRAPFVVVPRVPARTVFQEALRRRRKARFATTPFPPLPPAGMNTEAYRSPRSIPHSGGPILAHCGLVGHSLKRRLVSENVLEHYTVRFCIRVCQDTGTRRERYRPAAGSRRRCYQIIAFARPANFGGRFRAARRTISSPKRGSRTVSELATCSPSYAPHQ
jgi:hypothetical protein